MATVARCAPLALLALIAGLYCCASQPAPGKLPPADVNGVWEGQSRVTNCGITLGGIAERCNAVNSISLTLSQNGSQLIGAYHCSFGNIICRNGGADDVGRIYSGWIVGDAIFFTVNILADGSDCRFSGHAKGARLAGGYRCYQSGGLIEEGIFETNRLGG
jgi:hypothetical protein